MKRSRYPLFKIGDLVKFKERYSYQKFYGIVIKMGKEEDYDLDERFVRVLWAIPEGTTIHPERIRHLDLVAVI